MTHFTDKAGRSIRIVPLAPEHESAALSMIQDGLKFTPEEHAELGEETPERCLDAYFRKDRQEPEQKRALERWSHATQNDPASLQYYVALKDDQPVGVCGIYQATPGYTHRIGTTTPCEHMENNRTFWVDWFTVADSYRKQGIGTQLLKTSVEEAVHRAGQLLRQCHYAVYADAIALGFYRKMGLEPKAHIKGGHAVMSAPLLSLARRLGVAFAEPATTLHMLTGGTRIEVWAR